jgi:hypothetical protein
LNGIEWNPLGFVVWEDRKMRREGQMFFIREEGTNCVLGGKRGRDKLLRRLRPLPPSKESNFVLNEEEKPVSGRNERMWVGSRMVEGNPKIYFGIKKILIPFLLFQR